MDFNEAFATTVGEEGARRWLKAKGDQAIQDNYQAQLKRTREFVHLVITTRNRLEVLYGDDRTETGRVEATDKNRDVPRETLRTQKQQLLAQLREDFAKMKEGWGGQTEYDSWMANEVNNAKINAVAAYYELVPAFEHLLHLNGGDMVDFLPRPDSGARKFDRVINEPLALYDFGIVPARRRDVNLEPRFPRRPRQIDPVRVERPDVIVYIKEALSGICVAHKFRRGADTG